MEYQRVHFRDHVRADEEIRLMRYTVLGHHPPHSHEDFIEIAYIESGGGAQCIDGVEMPIAKGDLFLFNSHIVHSFTADEGKPLCISNCLFQPPVLDPTFKDCRDFLDVAYHYLFYSLYAADDPKNYIRLTGVSDRAVGKVFREMQDEYDEKENGYLQILKADLTKLLVLIFRLYKQDGSQRQNQAVYKKLVAQEASAYIRSHYDREISCEKLAARAYLSVNYFRRIFKEITGMTMMQMQQNIRMHVACDLLENTALSVNEIAQRVGYGDMKSFYRIFSAHTGRTPGQYRAGHRGEIPKEQG